MTALLCGSSIESKETKHFFFSMYRKKQWRAAQILKETHELWGSSESRMTAAETLKSFCWANEPNLNTNTVSSWNLSSAIKEMSFGTVWTAASCHNDSCHYCTIWEICWWKRVTYFSFVKVVKTKDVPSQSMRHIETVVNYRQTTDGLTWDHLTV